MAQDGIIWWNMLTRWAADLGCGGGLLFLKAGVYHIGRVQPVKAAGLRRAGELVP